MNAEIEDVLQRLETLTNTSREFAGKLFINMEEFFLLTTRLKKSLASSHVPPYDCEKCGHHGGAAAPDISIDVFTAIDHFEQSVENGMFPVFGKVAVNKDEYQKHLQQVRQFIR